MIRALARPFRSQKVQKLAYNMSGFNQYGLMRDDCLMETPDVLEALRRLPQHLQDERVFRLVRALQVDTERKVLPKEQWMQYEQDTHYLQPYLREVIRERKEREAWDAEG